MEDLTQGSMVLQESTFSSPEKDEFLVVGTRQFCLKVPGVIRLFVLLLFFLGKGTTPVLAQGISW